MVHWGILTLGKHDSENLWSSVNLEYSLLSIQESKLLEDADKILVCRAKM